MILALFGAVALVGTLGAGTSIIVNGPLKVMSQVNQKTQTEGQIMVASKMVMLDVNNIVMGADCDSDNLNEPRIWRNAAGAGPDGVTDSDGGGFLPMAIGSSKRDAWGTQYGYCVWDHGAIVNDVACTNGGTPHLQGFNSIDHPVVAIISAGPNGTFETPCRDFDNADNDSNGILDYGAGDDPLIAKGGDDILMAFSYAEAVEDNPGLWQLEINADGEAVAVMDGSIANVEFKGSNTAFGGTLELDGTEGLDIPDETVLITCDAAAEGQIRRNMGGTSPQLEICEDTGGSVYAWSPMAVSGASAPSTSTVAGQIYDPVFDPTLGNCTKNKGGPLEEVGHIDPGTLTTIWSDGDYIYAGNGDDLLVYTFDGSSFTFIDTIVASTASVSGVWNDGTYIYVSGHDGNTLNAYSFDGFTLTLVGSVSIATRATSVWGDGTHIYLGANNGGFYAYTFDGSTFTEHGSINPGGITGQIHGDNKYIYTADQNLRAFTFNGTTFVELDMFNTPGVVVNVWSDGTYVYAGTDSAGIFAFTFDGESFTQVASFALTEYVRGLWGDGQYIYVTNNYDGLFVFKFTGASFIQVDAIDPNRSWGLTGDGIYLYTANHSGGIYAYSGYTCTEAYVPDQKENYISQITVEQTATSGTTIETAGWSQILASDDYFDQTGVAFVVDRNASKASSPTAAITAVRTDDPAEGGFLFKTKSEYGYLFSDGFLTQDGYLGIEAGGSLESYLQIGFHVPGLDNAFQEGLLVTSAAGAPTDHMGYFGYYADGTDTNTILFSKALKVKGTNLIGSALREYLRFEQSQATTFFGDIEVEGSGQTVSIRNTSYSATDINDGQVIFKRKRVNEDDNAGTDLPLEDDDSIGRIDFKGSNGLSTILAGKIEAKVDGTVVAGTVPTEIDFTVPQTNFDPVTGNCAHHGGSKTGEIIAQTSAGTRFYRLWYQNGYIFTIANVTDTIHAFSFNGETFQELDSIVDPGNIQEITGDGEYIYVGNQGGSIRAYSFDGTSFTYLDEATIQLDNNQGLWTKDGYIFAAADNWGVTAYTFDGTSFTFVDRFSAITNSISDVWSDDDYVYAIDSTGGLYILTFDGANFSLVQHFNLYPNGHVYGYDGYIYITHGDNVYVMTFDGINLNLIDTLYVQNAAAMWHDGVSLYVARGSRGVAVVNFDGTTLTQHEIIDPISWTTTNVRGDGTYLFMPDSNPGGLYAVSGYDCHSVLKVADNDNVGVNKDDPQSQLHVGGRILADEGITIGGEANAACDVSVTDDEGLLRFDAASDSLQVCDGTNWIPVDQAVADPGVQLDCSPTPFELRNVTDGTTTTEYTSNGFVVGGLDTGEECYLSLSSSSISSKINVNGVDETSKIVAVENGDIIRVKATTGAADTCTECKISLGVQQASFNVGTGYGCKNGYPFDPNNHNCVRNNGSTFTEIDVFDTPGTALKIWGQDKDSYIYASDYDGSIRAYTFDGTDFTEVATFATPDNTFSIWHDGTYLYAADDASGIRAYTFDGTTFTEVGSYNTAGNARDIWGDGTYIYLADLAGDLRVYTFNGTTFTELDNASTPDTVHAVWGDGTYIYAGGHNSGIHAFVFDGSSLTEVGSFDTPGATIDVWDDGEYIYVADWNGGARAYSFDGSTFTEEGTFAMPNATGVWGDGTHVYVTDSGNGVYALTFDGSTFTQVDTFNTPGAANDVWGNGTYIYVADGTSGIRAYSGFECTFSEALPTPTYDYFDPEAANCKVNEGGPFNLVDSDNAGGTLTARGVWSNNDYIFVADNTNNIRAYTFNGSTLTLRTTHALPGPTEKVWGDEHYIYVSDQWYDLVVMTYNGTSFTEVARYDVTTSFVYDAWSDGEYIYTASAGDGIQAYTFNGASLSLIDTYNTPGDARGIWGDGKYIYLGDDANGLMVFHFNGERFTHLDTDSTHRGHGVWGDGNYIYVASAWGVGLNAYSFDGYELTLLDNETIYDPYDVWADGTHVYVASAGSGVFAYTFDGTTLTQVDQYNTAGNALGVWGDGEYVYAADGTNGLLAFSGFKCLAAEPPITDFDPEAANCMANNGGDFSLEGTYDTSGTAQSVWSDGVYTFVADRLDGLSVYSFDGSTFTEEDRHDTAGDNVYDVWSDGAYIYVADGSGGTQEVRAYSFDGSTLTVASSFNAPGSMYSIYGDGRYIYAAGSTLHAFTFNGTTFTEVDNIATGGTAWDTWSDGNYVYIANANSVRIYRFNGSTLSLVENYTSVTNPRGIWSDGTYLYVADGTGGVRAFTFNGSNLTLNGIYDTPGSARRVWGDGVSIYVSDAGDGVHALTFDGTDFTLQYTYDTTGSAYGAWGDGTYIYVADQGSGIHAFSGFECTAAVGFLDPDPFDPEAGNCTLSASGPFVEAGDYDTPNRAYSVWSDGVYTYVADQSGGVRAFTFDGSTFTLEDSNASAHQSNDVWSDGTYIYEANDAGGIRALTFDGSTLSVAGTQATTDRAEGIWGDGTYIYVADKSAGVHAFTFNGSTFTLIDTYDTGNNALKIWSDGTYIYVADENDGVYGLTFNGSTFTLGGTYDTTGRAESVWGDGTYVYVADSDDGIIAFTFDGTTFTVEGSYNTSGSAVDVWHDGTHLYVADDGSGIHAFTFDGSTFTLENTYNTPGGSFGVWGDGTYIYVADDSSGLRAYTGFECLDTDPTPPPPPPFNPDAANCQINAGGPLVQEDSVALGANDGWGDGNYTYMTANNRIYAYNYDGASLTELSNDYFGSANGVWGDGTYIYVVGSSSIRAYTFDGSTFTQEGNLVLADTQHVWGDGTYIYVADGTSGIRALSFDGSTFTLEDTYNTTGDANGVWGDGTYIYLADGTSGILAFSFDGSTFTLEDTYNTANAALQVFGDGTYIYLADGGGGNNIHAYTFDGSTFTQEATTTVGYGYDIWTDGSYIYTANGTGGIEAHSFDGSTFTSESTVGAGTAWTIWGDGNGIYGGYFTNTFEAFSGFECLLAQ